MKRYVLMVIIITFSFQFTSLLANNKETKTREALNILLGYRKMMADNGPLYDLIFNPEKYIEYKELSDSKSLILIKNESNQTEFKITATYENGVLKHMEEVISRHPDVLEQIHTPRDFFILWNQGSISRPGKFGNEVAYTFMFEYDSDRLVLVKRAFKGWEDYPDQIQHFNLFYTEGKLDSMICKDSASRVLERAFYNDRQKPDSLLYFGKNDGKKYKASYYQYEGTTTSSRVEGAFVEKIVLSDDMRIVQKLFVEESSRGFEPKYQTYTYEGDLLQSSKIYAVPFTLKSKTVAERLSPDFIDSILQEEIHPDVYTYQYDANKHLQIMIKVRDISLIYIKEEFRFKEDESGLVTEITGRTLDKKTKSRA